MKAMDERVDLGWLFLFPFIYGCLQMTVIVRGNVVTLAIIANIVFCRYFT